MRVVFLIIIALVFVNAGASMAQELIIYPAQGQSQEQIEKDKFECYSWAKGQSGFDPMAPPTTSTPPPQQEAKQGGALRGAARGAAIGAAAGAIIGNSDDARKGAGVGLAAGAIGGRARRRDQDRKQAAAEQQWSEQEVKKYEQNRASYNRAFSACMEGRSYSVK